MKVCKHIKTAAQIFISKLSSKTLQSSLLLLSFRSDMVEPSSSSIVIRIWQGQAFFSVIVYCHSNLAKSSLRLLSSWSGKAKLSSASSSTVIPFWQGPVFFSVIVYCNSNLAKLSLRLRLLSFRSGKIKPFSASSYGGGYTGLQLD